MLPSLNKNLSQYYSALLTLIAAIWLHKLSNQFVFFRLCCQSQAVGFGIWSSNQRSVSSSLEIVVKNEPIHVKYICI